jgi:hypothetical protein
MRNDRAQIYNKITSELHIKLKRANYFSHLNWSDQKVASFRIV